MHLNCKCWNMYTNHRSWVCETCMANTFMSTHNLWPEGAWMPQTGFCMVGWHSKNRPCDASTTVSNIKPPCAACLFWADECCQLIARSKLHHSAEHGLIPISCNHSVYHQCWSQRLEISASHCSDMPLPVWNTSNLAILGFVACNLMRLGSLHSDIIAMQPQLGQHPVDSQRRSQSLVSMDDSKSCLRTTGCTNSYHERVQNANWTLLVCKACAL